MSAPTILRAVVVDDEGPARDRVRRLLRQHPDVTLVGEAGDVAAAVEIIDREQPDLCFLDVEIPGGDGFDVLRAVRHLPRVIFTTAYDQYAVRAFEVHSLDYLLKPFAPERFAEALGRVRDAARRDPPGDEAIDQLRAELREERAARSAVEGASPAVLSSPERIPARKGSRIVVLDPTEILWFEAETTLVFAWTVEGRFLVERTLSDLESRMGPAFFRAHRRCLVRLDRIAEIRPQEGGTFRMTLRDASGSSLPLSRRQARRLRERLAW